MKISGMILSGGMSRRMGSDKSLKKINNKKLVKLVLDKVSKQVDYAFINSNKLTKKNININIDIIKDCLEGHLGPLVGILTGIKWLNKKKGFNFLVSFPVDSPFFPDDLVSRFQKYSENYDIIIANSKNRNHPVFSMWNLNLEKELEQSIKNGVRKIEDFTRKKKTKVVKFTNIEYDPFFNINTADDLKFAEKHLIGKIS